MKITETPLQHSLKSETAWEGEKKQLYLAVPNPVQITRSADVQLPPK